MTFCVAVPMFVDVPSFLRFILIPLFFGVCSHTRMFFFACIDMPVSMHHARMHANIGMYIYIYIIIYPMSSS